MKLVKSIVDTRNNLIGFWLRGKESEFGNFGGNNEVERPVQMVEIIQKGFKNNQISIRDGKVIEQAGFKINELPMSIFDGKANIVDIDNQIFLGSRIVRDGKLLGFKVMLAGNTAKFRYDDVIKLTGWFKPGNFIVRSVGSKLYIAGKPGVLKLEELPEEIIGENVQRSKRKRIGTGGQLKENINAKGIYNDKDLLTLYSMIREFDGVVVKLPTEQYTAATKTDKKVAGEFRDLCIGEIGDPYIQFGEKKLNANTTFKKVGNVMVPIPGGLPFPVYTFTWTTKSIFLSGENYIKRFAIAVKPEGVEKIKQEYEAALAIKPITDKNFTGPIVQLTGKNDLVFFEVDTSKLSIISPDRAASYILPNKEIRNIVYQLAHAKAHNKFCNGLRSEILEQANSSNTRVVDKRPFGIYAGMSGEYLKAIHDAGIDIFSGAYTKLEDKEKESCTAGPEEDEEHVIQIEYGLKGTDIGKLTYAMMKAKQEHKMLDEFLVMQVDKFAKITDLKEKYAEMNKYQDGIEKAIYDCRRKLWLHKVAMYYLGEGKIHTHDKDEWIENVKSRAKANVFDCVEPGCEGLYVAISGITI